MVMGILNVTPDSFSDGGQFLGPAAVDHARRMVCEGADVIDIGAESTRPGSEKVSPGEQISRLADVLPAVARLGRPVSIDTTSAQVAQWALAAGASIINDVSAGREDPDLLPLAASRGAGVVLMHMLGQPKSMQERPHYDDVVGEVRGFLSRRLAAAADCGVPAERCIVDPGIGFGKTVEHNLALLAGMDALCTLGVPVMVGASRKSFIGAVTGEGEPARRTGGSLAAACMAYLGGATVFRVHDVAPTRQGLDVLSRIVRAKR